MSGYSFKFDKGDKIIDAEAPLGEWIVQSRLIDVDTGDPTYIIRSAHTQAPVYARTVDEKYKKVK